KGRTERENSSSRVLSCARQEAHSPTFGLRQGCSRQRLLPELPDQGCSPTPESLEADAQAAVQVGRTPSFDICDIRHTMRSEAIVVSTKFSDFFKEIEAEARKEGPEAVAQLEAFREHYRLGRQLAE